MSSDRHDDGHDAARHGGHRHHAHDHRHNPDVHGHAHGAGSDERRIAAAVVIIFIFTLVEAAGGILSGSLALLADAGHMVSDAAALGMSWMALRVGRRPADAMRSYGYKRLEVLVAFVNGCTLIVIAVWVAFEAFRRLHAPVAVLGGPMLGVAIAGLLAHVVAFLILSGGSRDSLNTRSAWLHVLGDLLGFAIAIIGAIVVLATGWSPIDPLLSILIGLVILKSAGEIVRSSAHILLEGAPSGFDAGALRADLIAAVPAVEEVHHIHAWSITQEQSLVTLHVRCASDADPESIVPAVCRRLQERFGISHSTIQVDYDDCTDEQHR